MIAALLALGIALSPTSAVAFDEWDRLTWEYELPPATITVDAAWMHANALGAYLGQDAEGRAIVGIRAASEEALRNNIAHEAAHALLNPTGMPIDEQHEWTDAFALCVHGHEAADYAMHSCSDVRNFFARFHR